MENPFIYLQRQLQNPAKLVGRIAPNPPRRVEGNAPYQVLQLPLQFATGDQFHDRREIRKDLLSRFLSGQSGS